MKQGVKTLVKTLVYDIKISRDIEDEEFDEVGFYQEISETQNQDFDEAINMLSGTRNLAEIMNLS